MTDALEVLKQELGENDIEVTLQSLKELPTIAQAMGPVDTVEKLLPYLCEVAGFDSSTDHKVPSPADSVKSDEAMTVIAEQLGAFKDVVGDVKHLKQILILLQKLASSQETCIRSAATKSFQSIVPSCANDEELMLLLLSMCKKLSADECFSPRCSAPTLIDAVYKCLGENRVEEKSQLRSLFSQLCIDEAPLVRKQALSNLGRFGHTIGSTLFKLEFDNVVKSTLAETQEGVRIYTVMIVKDFSEDCSDADFREILLPILQHCLVEQSWKIRRSLAHELHFIASQAGKSAATEFLLPMYNELLKDPQNEVRVVALRNIVKFAATVDAAQFDKLVGVTLPDIASEASQSCRTVLSMNLIHLSPILGKNSTEALIIPLMKDLLEDDTSSLRINLLQNISILVDVIGAEPVVNQVIPKVLPLVTDEKWRVRQTAVENLSSLAKSITTNNFESKISDILLESLKDHVAAVRNSAANQIIQLCDLFGEEWATTVMLPKAMELYESSSNNLHRMVPLRIIEKASSSTLPAEVLQGVFLPCILKALSDSIVNVRICAAKASITFGKKMAGDFKKKLIEALDTASNDEDADVKHFAGLAVEALK